MDILALGRANLDAAMIEQAAPASHGYVRNEGCVHCGHAGFADTVLPPAVRCDLHAQAE
jgi:hypothetical protein